MSISFLTYPVVYELTERVLIRIKQIIFNNSFYLWMIPHLLHVEYLHCSFFEDSFFNLLNILSGLKGLSESIRKGFW